MIFLTKLKNYSLKIGLIMGVVIFSFLFSNNVKAEIVNQYQVVGENAYNWGFSNSFPTQTFTPSASSLSSISVEMKKQRTLVGNGFTLRICKFTTYSRYCTGTGNDLLFQQAYTGTNYLDARLALNAYTDINFPLGNLTVTPHQKYIMIFDGNAGSPDYLYNKYNNVDVYALGEATKNGVPLNYDLNFQTFEYESNLRFDAPIFHGVYQDFSDWRMFYSYDNSTTSTSTIYYLQVAYGNQVNQLNLIDIDIVPALSNVSWRLAKSNNLTDGTWYAQATLYKDAVAYATTTVIHFFIDSVNGDNFFDGVISTTKITNLTTDLCSGIDTSSFFGAIECGFKKIIDWAFTPKVALIEDIQKVKDDLVLQFPFNAITDLTTTISAVIASTSTSTLNQSISIPFIQNTGTSTDFYMLPVISSTSMPNLIGQSNTSLFRNGLGYLFWIGAMMIVFFSFKKLW